MNWDRIQGNWKQVTGHAKQRWGKLTDDDMTAIAGQRDKLAGKIQERYGVMKEEAERQLVSWESKAKDAWFDTQPANAIKASTRFPRNSP